MLSNDLMVVDGTKYVHGQGLFSTPPPPYQLCNPPSIPSNHYEGPFPLG